MAANCCLFPSISFSSGAVIYEDKTMDAALEGMGENKIKYTIVSHADVMNVKVKLIYLKFCN